MPLPELSSWLTEQGLGDLSTVLSGANIGSLSDLAGLDLSQLEGLGITGDVQSALLGALQGSLNANLPTSSMALSLPFDISLSTGTVGTLDLDALRASLLALVPAASDLQLTAPDGDGGSSVGVKFVLPDVLSVDSVISLLNGLDVGSLSTSLGVDLASFNVASVAADFFVSALPLPDDLSAWLTSQGLESLLPTLQGASITSLPELAALSVADLTALGLPALSVENVLGSLTAILPPLPTALPDLSGWLDEYGLSAIAPKLSTGGITSLDALKLLSPSGLSDLSLSSAEVTSVMSALARTLANVLPVPSLRASFTSDVLIGGETGFAATVSGTIDTDEGSASLTVEHPGGWSPVPSLADYFATPAFVGSVAFGVGGVRLAMSCDAEFLAPIVIVPDMVQVTGHPQSSAAGVSAECGVEPADERQRVRLVGGVRRWAEAGLWDGDPTRAWRARRDVVGWSDDAVPEHIRGVGAASWSAERPGGADPEWHAGVQQRDSRRELVARADRRRWTLVPGICSS